MKARLSTGTKRPFACFRDDLHEEMAIAEARSIIAAEESPEPYGLVNGSPTAYGSLTSYWCKPARFALADSLRAFDAMSLDDVAALQA